MSAHSHLVFHDHEVHNLMMHGRPGTRGGAVSAMESVGENDNVNHSNRSLPTTPGSSHQHAPLSHRTLVRESIDAANREAQEAQVHQHRPASGIGGQHSRASSATNLHASPSVSARGAPSISMGQDSYVASQREQILAAQQQQQRQGQDGSVDSESARLHAHDHSAPAEPPQRSLSRNSRPLPGAGGGGGVGMSYDHSSQHALHAGSGMAGSSLAGAGVSHVTATVAVDADGNALHDAHNDDLELQQRLAATGGSYEQSNEHFDVHEADDQGQHHQHEQQQEQEQQQQEGDEDYGDDEDFSPAARVDAAASAQGTGREDDHHQGDADAEAEAEGNFDGDDGTGGGGFVVDNGDEPVEHMYDQDGNPLGPQEEQHTARSSELDAPPEPEHSASPHMGRMRASQQQGHVADSMAGFDVHHAEDEHQAQGGQSQSQSQRQHLAPTSSASSTKRSQRSTRMAANNAQLSELMAQQDAYEPQPPSSWRATKGGGGGLIKVDPNSRTATTIGGTVVPLDSSSSGGGALASGRRK
jgi:hypothetical protein